VLAQLVTFHAPSDLRIACCVGPDRRADWEWVKWLPHAADPRRADAAGPVRLAAGSLADLAGLLGPDLGERPPFARGRAAADLPPLGVVVDGGDTTPHPPLDGDRAGVTFVHAGGWPAAPDPASLDLVVRHGPLA